MLNACWVAVCLCEGSVLNRDYHFLDEYDFINGNSIIVACIIQNKTEHKLRSNNTSTLPV